MCCKKCYKVHSFDAYIQNAYIPFSTVQLTLRPLSISASYIVNPATKVIQHIISSSTNTDNGDIMAEILSIKTQYLPCHLMDTIDEFCPTNTCCYNLISPIETYI